MQDDRLTQIEKMLSQGMTEEQIIQALTGAQPPLKKEGPYQHPATKATSIGPAPARMPKLAREALTLFTGVADPIDVPQGRGTLPLPFTEKVLYPADALMSAIGVGQLSKLPKAIASLMGRKDATARAVNTLANQQFPYRTLDPRRLLPAGRPPMPDIPANMIDTELVSLAPDPVGGFDFFPQEIMERAAGTLVNPQSGNRIVDVAGKVAKGAAKKTKK